MNTKRIVAVFAVFLFCAALGSCRLNGAWTDGARKPAAKALATVMAPSAAVPGADEPALGAAANAGASRVTETNLAELNLAATNVAATRGALNLEHIAEIERAGSYHPGLAMAEAGLRENSGDYSGAAVAAYKELSWAYGYSAASREQVEEGLLGVLAAFENGTTDPVPLPSVPLPSVPLPSVPLPSVQASGTDAVRGCIAFLREDWARAEELLSKAIVPGEEPDSFLRWMILVCALEGKEKIPGEKQAARSAYGAIRARYALFPEYWYRGARAFSPGKNYSANDLNIAAVYAEQCINTSPGGPFALECREILFDYLGLASGGGAAAGNSSGIRTMVEIENIINVSVSTNNPGVLEDLFPLMALPENPYTLYALGALKALSSVPGFRTFFGESAAKSPGRLGDRLGYIYRG